MPACFRRALACWINDPSSVGLMPSDAEGELAEAEGWDGAEGSGEVAEVEAVDAAGEVLAGEATLLGGRPA